MQLNKVFHNYYEIICTPSFLTSTMCYTAAFSGLIAYFQVSPILLMDGYSLAPSQYGWCSMIIAINYLLGGLFVKRSVHYFGANKMLKMGALLLIIGGVFMLISYLFAWHTIFSILLPASIYVLGARIVIPNAIASSLAEVRHLGGSSSALIGCIQMFGSSIISLLMSTCNNTSSLSLAVVLTTLGFVTFSICLLDRR